MMSKLHCINPDLGVNLGTRKYWHIALEGVNRIDRYIPNRGILEQENGVMMGRKLVERQLKLSAI